MSPPQANDAKSDKAGAAMESDEFGFCTEFIIRLSDVGARNFDENSMREELATIGNSIVRVRDDDIVKVTCSYAGACKSSAHGQKTWYIR